MVRVLLPSHIDNQIFSIIYEDNKVDTFPLEACPNVKMWTPLKVTFNEYNRPIRAEIFEAEQCSIEDCAINLPIIDNYQ